MNKCEHVNNFCAVCGCYAPKDHNRNITKAVEDGYDAYFKLILQKKWYIPEVVCTYCQTSLLNRQKMRYVLLNSFAYFEN